MKKLISGRTLFCSMTRSLGVAFFASLLLSSCAATNTFKKTVTNVYEASTSHEAFLRAETRLHTLQPGEALDDKALGFKYLRLENFLEGKKTLVVSTDGWIQSMSGNVVGAVYGLGRPYAREGSTIYGRHVFGYVWGGATLTPKYVLRTKATLISQAEYQTLEERKQPGIGIVAKFEGEEGLFFKELKVHEIRVLPFRGSPDLTKDALIAEDSKVVEVTPKQLTEDLFKVYSKPSYEDARTKLMSLNMDKDWWDVIAMLEGLFITNDYGQTYVLFMKGFANKESDNRWVKLAPDAIYEVWPFGYTENNREVVELSVVFRNGRLYRVIPYQPKDELIRQLGKGN